MDYINQSKPSYDEAFRINGEIVRFSPKEAELVELFVRAWEERSSPSDPDSSMLTADDLRRAQVDNYQIVIHQINKRSSGLIETIRLSPAAAKTLRNSWKIARKSARGRVPVKGWRLNVSQDMRVERLSRQKQASIVEKPRSRKVTHTNLIDPDHKIVILYNNKSYEYLGRAARVLRHVLRAGVCGASPNEIALGMGLTPDQLSVVYVAVQAIRKSNSSLLYTLGGGRGWRLLSPGRTHLVYDTHEGVPIIPLKPLLLSPIDGGPKEG